MKEWLREKNGPGVQEWADGSRYEGEFLSGLKHGSGTFTWPNGECYKGSFYKDYRHGRGTYVWPDGSQFIGKFYLNRKEGYGVHRFPDGTIFKGLYHADERFGPGVMSYHDGFQDVGLWYRQWLLRLCTTVKGGFTLTDFPEHMARLPQQHLVKIQSQPSFTKKSQFFTADTHLLDDSSLLVDEFILPPGIEKYSTDSDHLPVPRRLREELDLNFFNRSDIRTPLFPKGLPLEQRMEAHIYTHRFEIEDLDWDVAAVLALNRENFGSKGPLELRSERLIREASLGDLQNVQSILRYGKVHPDVGDRNGHSALIAATVNCHLDVINFLLDSGVDVNKLNYEGMSALAVCSVLYYPLHSLQETVAEKTSQDVTTGAEISVSSTLANSPQGSAAEPKDEVDTELPAVKPEACNIAQEPVTPKQTKEIINPSKDEKVPQQARYEQSRVLEAKLPELSDASDWCQSDDDSENVFSTEKKEKTYRNKSQGNDSGFDLASSVASKHTDSAEDTVQQKSETERHESHWATMMLLLERGADPNASSIPMPVIFLAIKAGHVEAVRRLLECGARTDVHLTAEQKGLYPLHVAAGLIGLEGPKITAMILHAIADPDVKAEDAGEVYHLDKILMEEQVGDVSTSSLGSGPPACIYTSSIVAAKEGGRTPLHVACQKDTDYTNARDVVSILLSHKASTDHLWSGHSPLSLSIASGNDFAVDELLAVGADPNLPLSCRVGSALCAVANIHYNSGPRPHNRIKLVEKLIKAGANILMPVMVGERNRSGIGTAVDYAYYMFNKDWRVAHTPYHALKQQEREAYNARRQLLTMMADLTRQAATNMEKQRLENEKKQGIKSNSPTDKFVFTRTGAIPPAERARVPKTAEEQRESVSTAQKRKPLFKYCYQCGRSAWVALTPCSRCHEVFYCSKTCKLKAWNERHKEECVRVPESGRPEGSHMSGDLQCLLSSKSSRKGTNLNFKMDKPYSGKAASHIPTRQHDPEENYSFI
ncbi:ankyrin repeat and MYND domain-containing protein 1 [Silurus asotus]|uniref:Ankyrin repeat and MYND domain-containing protein 1 n=1 Tax=Silurus asotus TaxID=30991 RepID=A0AAD5A526_SILAS|nr:ankyrin repeat and MYND domain-containing protein 1 [Silurus asotus]